MKRVILMLGIPFLMGACNEAKSKEEPLNEGKEIAVAMDSPVSVERGKYLVNTIGCTDCHTPKRMTENGPEPNPELFLSGHPSTEKLPPLDPSEVTGYVAFSMGLTASVGPWGTSFAANLTPDDTGIGNWTEEQFLTSIKEGKYKGSMNSRTLLPPMPWQQYRMLTDNDLKSIFKYLETLKPVENVVPGPIPPTGN
ncbi:diheme cytochrome c-553 [Sediminicola sp. 1XM1-17]|uniref:diheme cytochrome c-553 n=1 Tax=Sediminicola sp. 1XM1-17 TaxID=3127702 RepID=UPI0030789510